MKWHQDIQYWPHTNYSPLTIGVYMDDVGDEQGPLAVVPGSQDGDLYSLYDGKDQWGWLAHRRRRESGWRRSGGLPAGPGRLAHDSQLPNRARLQAKRVGARPATAPERLLGR